MSERLLAPTDQDIRTQCAVSWKIVVSEWWPVIAVSLTLNVGDGVRLIKPAKLYMCTQTHYKHDEDGRTAPGMRGHGSVPLSNSGNIVTRIGLRHLQFICDIYTEFQTCVSRLYGLCLYATDKWIDLRADMDLTLSH